EARGDLVARCDADDLLPPGRLAWQVRWLGEHPEFGAVGGQFTTIDTRGQGVAAIAWSGKEAHEITHDLRAGVVHCHFCTLGVRREWLGGLGGCGGYFETAEDIDLMLRLSEVAGVWFEPRPWYLYRLHDTSVTHTQKRALRDFYEATARAFAAQRR